MTAQQAFAFVRGEAVAEPPAALYIPPSALRVVLDDFEGPLDLLLYLVRKHKFDILDIPMTPLCRQYNAYVEEIVKQNLELAADYLTMSALLVQIKTKMLLPRPPPEEDAEDDPRADLVRRMLEYERVRESAKSIGELPRRGRDFASPQVAVELPALPESKPRVQSSMLAAAFSAVLARSRAATPYIPAAVVLMSVREMMSGILRRLSAGARLAFRALVVPKQAGVTFLALLQLAYEQTVLLRQDSDEAELYITLREGGEGGRQ